MLIKPKRSQRPQFQRLVAAVSSAPATTDGNEDEMSSNESILHEAEDLRAAVASLNREMEALAASGAATGTGAGEAGLSHLLASWRDLVTMLDLGPPPRTRVCPVCGNVGMRAATRCGYCWSALAPLPEHAAEPGHARGTD